MTDDEASFDAKPWLVGDGFADRGGESFADIGRALHTANSRGGHDFVFFLCRTRAAADDGAGVTHTPSGRRGLSRNEADDGLAHASANEFRRLLLGIPTNFANHDNGMRVRIVVEEANGIEERSADDGIAADTDAGRLADAQ